jgi:hypothetical protein
MFCWRGFRIIRVVHQPLLVPEELLHRNPEVRPADVRRVAVVDPMEGAQNHHLVDGHGAKHLCGPFLSKFIPLGFIEDFHHFIHGLELNAFVLPEESSLSLLNASDHVILDGVYFGFLLFGEVQVLLDVDFNAVEKILRPHLLGHLILRQGFLDAAIAGDARKVAKQEHSREDACSNEGWTA